MLTLLDKIKWYLVVAAISATLAYYFTSKAAQDRYTAIFETQEKTIEKMQILLDKYKKTSTKKVTVYDPKTGNKVKEVEETKIVEKDKSKTIKEVVKETVVKQVVKDGPKNVVLVGAGTNLETCGSNSKNCLDKIYSVEYLRKWGVLNYGTRFSSDKQVGVVVGISF